MRSIASNKAGRGASLAARVAAVVVIVVAGAVGAASAQPRAEQGMAVEQKRIELVVGEQITLPTQGIRHYSEGVPGIIDVKLPKDSTDFVVVLGLAPGTTSLLFVTRDASYALNYTVTVLPRERVGAVAAEDTIRLDFYFVEMSAGLSRRVGVLWPGTAAGTGALGASVDLAVGVDLRISRITEATATIAGNVLPRLDFAQAAGWAKVLRHASLVTTNGESGAFSSGGEVNVRVSSGLAANLAQIEHGTKVSVTPRYDRESRRIEVRIGAEVATLGAEAVDGLPQRNLTSVSTIVNVELGQAIVLAGLLGQSEAVDRAGLPWLSQIPVLGYLFGSRVTSREQTENVLVIVPTVVEAVPSDRRDLVDAALGAYRGFRGRFEGAPAHERLTPAPAPQEVPR